MRTAFAFFATLALAASGARGGPGPPRNGTGILGVPDAETLPSGSSVLGTEARLDRTPDRIDVGVAPISVALGLGRVELAASLRESGMPGDPRPSAPLGTAALKVRLFDAGSWTPAVAVGIAADRINDAPRGAARLLVSTPPLLRIRLALAAGFEAPEWRVANAEPTAAAALSLALPRGFALLAAGHATPDGPKLESGAQWSGAGWLSFGIGFERLPRDNQNRFVLSIAVQATPRRRVTRAAAEAEPSPVAPVEASRPSFTEDRPRFRLRPHRATGADGGTP